MKKYLCLIDVLLITLIYFAFVIFTGLAEYCNAGFYNGVLFLFAYPLLEEYFFRGFVQKKLKEVMTGKIFIITYANILTSLLFMLIHLIFSLSISSMLVFIPSIMLGCLYDSYGRIYIPIVFHSLFNLNVFLCYKAGFLYNIMN